MMTQPVNGHIDDMRHKICIDRDDLQVDPLHICQMMDILAELIFKACVGVQLILVDTIDVHE